jgi:general secretion pathway protein I
MSRVGREEAGFTLLEVMVAVAILATAFTALLGLHARNLRTIAYDRAYTEALFLARERIAELELSGAPDIGDQSGDFEGVYPGQYPGFRWEQTVVPAPLLANVREVTVRVIPPEGEGASSELTLWLRAQ